MKTSVRPLPLAAALLFFLSLSWAVFAQEPADKSAPPAAPAAPAAEKPDATPAPAAAPAPEKSELRRLDAPEEKADDADNADEKLDDAKADADSEKISPSAEPATEKSKAKNGRGHRHGSRGHNNGDARVSFLGDSTLAAGEFADAVISIGGSSTASGHVGDAVVSVAGSSTSDAVVGNAVVSVAGDTRINGGSVGDAAVAVLGSNYVNARVENAVVAVIGNIELGPKADVGDVVCVGGTVTRDPHAVVRGQVSHVGIALPLIGSNFEGVHAWFRHCLLLGRPLAFGPHLMWVWWIALGLLAFYVVLALLFPRGIERCAETLEQRPGYSILTAFLVTLLAPLAVILLLITVVGAPALVVFLFAAGLFGKAVMLAWIGRRITTRIGDARFAAPVVAVLIGGVIVLGLYTVPFLGFLVAKLLSWLGIGVVVYTLILGSKRNKAARVAAANAAASAARAASVAASSVSAAPVAPAVASVVPAVSSFAPGVVTPVPPADASPATEPAAAPTGDGAASTPPPVTPPAPPVIPVAPPPFVPAASVAVPAATLPRAGFWIRVAAAGLDAVLVAIAMHLLPNMLQPNFMLLVAAYSVVLWALRGTTVGGIVCGLKVVRLDDRPLDWATAIVRALGGFLSFMVAGLGFIWVAFDDQKQSWHDKIAGTTVVHVPKGTSLV